MHAGTAILSSGKALAPDDAFLDCVHCGLCLQACPTYLELGTEPDSPRGRLYLMRALSRKELALDREAVEHLDLCLGCRSCETACPSGVRYGSLIESARCWMQENHRRPLGTRLKRRSMELLFSRPGWLSRLVGLLRLGERTGALRVLSRLLPRDSTLAYLLALLPAPFPRPRRLPPLLPAVGPQLGSVTLLEGCVMPLLFPETNRNTAELLARAGFAVSVPKGQNCCGALSLHCGNKREALALVRHNVDLFMQATGEYLVTNSAGCGAMLKQYGQLLSGDERYAARAQALSSKVRDVHELLVEARLEIPPLPPTAVAYHDPCHLVHAQGIHSQPRRLLEMIPGVRLLEIEESDICCGSAGDYNLLHPAMGRRLLARKVAAIKRTKADMVAAANPGCAMQIRAGLLLDGSEKPVKHTVDIVADAFRHAK